MEVGEQTEAFFRGRGDDDASIGLPLRFEHNREGISPLEAVAIRWVLDRRDDILNIHDQDRWQSIDSRISLSRLVHLDLNVVRTGLVSARDTQREASPDISDRGGDGGRPQEFDVSVGRSEAECHSLCPYFLRLNAVLVGVGPDHDVNLLDLNTRGIREAYVGELGVLDEGWVGELQE